MSRTAKWEHPSDSFRARHAEERRARPAGRDRRAFEADLEAEAPCEAFLLCDRPATTSLPHPALGAVPACERCAQKLS